MAAVTEYKRRKGAVPKNCAFFRVCAFVLCVCLGFYVYSVVARNKLVNYEH